MKQPVLVIPIIVLGALLLAACSTSATKLAVNNRDGSKASGAKEGKVVIANTPEKFTTQPATRDVPSEAVTLFPVKVKGLYGFIDQTGKMTIQPKFTTAQMFSEGLAAAQLNGKWGYIDKAGEWVIKPQFAAAIPFAEGLASVKGENLFGVINKKGEMVIRQVCRDQPVLGRLRGDPDHTEDGLWRCQRLGLHRP